MRRWVLAWLVALLSVCLPEGALADGAWQHDETAHYRFRWLDGSLRGFAAGLVAGVEAHHSRIYGELGLSPEAGGPTEVVLVSDADALNRIARAENEGSRPPEWADGLAYPLRRRIYLQASRGPDELDKTFQHEISHVALGTLAQGRAPVWLAEGLAIQQSEPIAFERIWLLTEAATMGALHDLDDLAAGFPAGGARAGVAYAQSVHFVGYLRKTFGEERFARFLEVLGEPGGPSEAPEAALDRAMRAAFRLPLATVERDWRESLRLWWGWIPVVFGSTTLWAVTVLLLVGAWRRKRREKAARLAVLRSREAEEMAEDIEVAHALRPPPSLFDPYDGQPPTIH
ncbi:MAG: hypothetical protein KC613_09820 [Myxococcales bacterium]|nr:hypothetical protein [Myxococcales bacterium]